MRARDRRLRGERGGGTLVEVEIGGGACQAQQHPRRLAVGRERAHRLTQQPDVVRAVDAIEKAAAAGRVP